MRALFAALAAIFIIAGSLRATDLPTIKAALPDITSPQGGAVPSIDLRNFFEITDIHGQVVQFRTTGGTFNIEMFPAAAPLSVANFLNYVNGGRYATTFVHRSDQSLGVIQGGGYYIATVVPLDVEPIAKDPPIALEYNLPNVRGTIALARTAVLDSATSEWFINTVDNTTTLGPGNGGGYAVFGRVTGTGMSVVDAIQALPVYSAGGPGSPFSQLPLTGYSTGVIVAANLIVMNAAEAVPIFPATAGQNSVVSFSVTNTNTTLVTATVSGSTLNLVLAPGAFGFADLTVTATDTNGNAVQNTFRVNVTAGTPEIALEQPAGNNLADGGSRAFPSVNVGNSSNLVFTIKTAANGNVTLTGTPEVAVDGADASEFTVTAQPVSPVIGSGGSTTFTVRFAPTSAGAKAAALHIANDDSDESPFDINLSGTGTVPEIAVEQPVGNGLADGGDLAFPLVNIGSSADLVFTIKNTGDGSLMLTGTPKVAVDGADAAVFTVIAQPVSPVSGLGGSTPFTVRFAPTSTGTKAAALHIANDDSDENPFDINLTGTGNARPTLTLPTSPVITEPTSANGAVVTFSVTANDAEDGPLTPIVTPPSGSTFPFGDTTVSVNATDSNGSKTTDSFTVRVTFLRPNLTTVNMGAHTNQPAPDAGTGALPAGTVLSTFGSPAISDFRTLAARVSMLAGRTMLAGICVEDSAGAQNLLAYQGGPAPEISAAGATFKRFLDPVIASDGSVAFVGTFQGAGIRTTEDLAVWTDAFGPTIEPVLREGHVVLGLPARTRLKAVPSLSLRNGELLVLATLSPVPGVVSLVNDTVLLRMTDASTATVLLREGRALARVPGSRIKSFSVLSPALGSAGHGRWHVDGVVIAKVVLYDGRTLLVKIASDGTTTPLLSTANRATPVNAQARWKSFGLPAVGSEGAGFVVAATLRQGPGGVVAGKDTALLFSPDGTAWSVFAREGDAAPVTPAGPLYATLLDPLVNDAGQVAYVASLRGPGITTTNKAGIFAGSPGNVGLVARLGAHPPDEAGTATTAVWSRFITCALPSGSDAGVIFLAETSGGDPLAGNKVGLWAVDSQGMLRRLLQTSDTLTTGGSPITRLTLLNAVPSVFGATRSFNATGSIALVATFADGSQSLLRVDVP